jgi:actin-related protein
VLRVVFKVVEEGSHKLRINFVDEDGKFVMPSIELPFEVKVPENDSFAYRNFILNIQRLKFEKFGQHAVDIAIDGRQEASIPLEVKQIPSQDKEDSDS